jgi:hypothetical protein
MIWSYVASNAHEANMPVYCALAGQGTVYRSMKEYKDKYRMIYHIIDGWKVYTLLLHLNMASNERPDILNLGPREGGAGLFMR